MKQVYLSRKTGYPLIDLVEKQGYLVNIVTEVGIVSKNTNNIMDVITGAGREIETCVDPRIATHADIYMCQLGLWSDAGIFIGDRSRISPKYPGDVIYNAVCTKDFFIHKNTSTDRDLAEAMLTWRQSFGSGNLCAIGVNQGYTRCMCLPVDDRSFITSDEGIAKALESQGAEALQISPGHIVLDGFEYGFIGGCAGNIYMDDTQRAIVFNGNLADHPDFEAIAEFIKCRNILPVWFDDYPLEDIGSILAVE